jgi:hypothetical protein
MGQSCPKHVYAGRFDERNCVYGSDFDVLDGLPTCEIKNGSLRVARSRVNERQRSREGNHALGVSCEILNIPAPKNPLIGEKVGRAEVMSSPPGGKQVCEQGGTQTAVEIVVRFERQSLSKNVSSQHDC